MRDLMIAICFVCLGASSALASEQCDSISLQADSVACHKSLISKIIDYFDDSNKPKTDKAFDFSVIGGPHYASDKGFGIGMVAEGLYRMDRADSLMQPSSVSIYGNATTGLYFNVGIEGTNIFPRDRYRLSYNADFKSFSTYFWGIGYESDIDDSNKSKYKYFMTQASLSLACRIADNLYLGPAFNIEYVHGSQFEKPWLWLGQDDKTFNLGVGFVAEYDTRDFISNPYKGVSVIVDQRFYPRFMGNSYAFSSTQVKATAYKQVWKGGVLAGLARAWFTYGNTPWGLLPTFNGTTSMRGYYEGRYRDKCLVAVCAELRQHIYGRSGAVLWVGAGNIFVSPKHFQLRQTLPNAGIGYRWEFKKRVNVRLDFGVGKNTTGFVFSINEAF